MYIAKESFLGVNSEAGFYSLFEDFINKRSRVYVIKGGPGTGKSTLMRSIGKQAEQMGLDVEYMHCSSDPASLDGIYVRELGACMVDGTPPHVLEPPYPGAIGNIVNIYPFWDREKLQAATAQIKELNGQISALFDRTYLYLGAAGKLQRDLQQIGNELCNRTKLKGYTERMSGKYLKPQNKAPHEEKRLLSAFTPDGNIFYKNTLQGGMDKVLVFEDEYGVSSKVMELLRVRALKRAQHYQLLPPAHPGPARAYCIRGYRTLCVHLKFPAQNRSAAILPHQYRAFSRRGPVKAQQGEDRLPHPRAGRNPRRGGRNSALLPQAPRRARRVL